MSQSLFHLFAKGCVYMEEGAVDASQLPWHEHGAFPGVFLKHLVTGAHSKGLFSSHLVRIDPGCSIGVHEHGTQTELHEVAEGKGVCCMQGNSVEYVPGVAAVIPCRVPHEVQAGSEGLLLLAKFVPPLC